MADNFNTSSVQGTGIANWIIDKADKEKARSSPGLFYSNVFLMRKY